MTMTCSYPIANGSTNIPRECRRIKEGHMLSPGNTNDHTQSIRSNQVKNPAWGNRKGPQSIGAEFAHKREISFHHWLLRKGRPVRRWLEGTIGYTFDEE